MELFFLPNRSKSSRSMSITMTKKRTDCVSKKIYLDLDISIVRYDIWYDKVGPKYERKPKNELMNHNMIMSLFQ